jgi:hypothetical protein
LEFHNAIRTAGRATGSAKAHDLEQKTLVTLAFATTLNP